MKSNFDFIKQCQPKLAQMGSLAEGYCYSDPESAAHKLRNFAELYVGFIYKEFSIPLNGAKDFFERLENVAFTRIVERSVIDALHAIRLKGNRAAHAKGVSTNDALFLVKEAYFLAAWIYVSYHGGIVDQLPAYRVPQPKSSAEEALKNDHARLEKMMALQSEELEMAKKELAELEIRNAEILSHITEMGSPVNLQQLEEFQIAGQKAIQDLDVEHISTRNNIRISDVFAAYELTEDQKNLVKELDYFLHSSKEKVFLLKGYAGTGKTFITKGLTEYFRSIGRNYLLAAPTGKASKVIAEKTRSPAYTIHKSIYSFKDIKEYREDDLSGSETYKYYADLKINDNSADTVYIVDEASMVSDIYNEGEFFRFGSGRLLFDFLKFVNLDHNDHFKKIIFIGDDAQLPPVGMNNSPALNAQYLRNEYNLESRECELTAVVRQKADSGVMKNSLKIRDSLKMHVFNQLDIDLCDDDVIELNYDDVIKQYLDSCNHKINADSIVLAYSNADVADYNRRIREEFFPNMTDIVRGDKVMAINNTEAPGFFISNGDFGIVRQVYDTSIERTIPLKRKSSETGTIEKTEVKLKFRRVELGFKDPEGVTRYFPSFVIENLLHSDKPQLSSDENKALYIDFRNRHRELKPGSIEFKQTLQSDPFFNAMKLKFGYAITCHKAQGSEWKNVFVKCKANTAQLTSDYFRWLYTAITRTSHKLYLIEPPHIKIGDDIKPVVQGSTDGIRLEVSTRVKEAVAGTGIEITDIYSYQFHDCFCFARESFSARLNVHFNAKGKISSVQAQKPSKFADELMKLLTPLTGVVVRSGNQRPIEFEESFLKDFHIRLEQSCEASGIKIVDLEPMQFKQRYSFAKDQQRVQYDIYYKASKVFSKCQLVGKTSNAGSLGDEVQSIITQGLK